MRLLLLPSLFILHLSPFPLCNASPCGDQGGKLVSITTGEQPIVTLTKKGTEVFVEPISTTPNAITWCLIDCGTYDITMTEPNNALFPWTIQVDGVEIDSSTTQTNKEDENFIDGKSLDTSVQVCESVGKIDSTPSVASVVPNNISSTSFMRRSLDIVTATTGSPSVAPTICDDEPNWQTEYPTVTCDIISTNGLWACYAFEQYTFGGKSPKEACCICGGGDHVVIPPSSAPTVTPSESPTSKPTLVLSHTPSISRTPTLMPSDQPTSCSDEIDWKIITKSDFEVKCSHLQSPDICPTLNALGQYEGKAASEACCICGGGQHKAVTPSASPSQCRDELDWKTPGPLALDCEGIAMNAALNCGLFVELFGTYRDKSENEACCACGGGDHVVVSPSLVPTVTPTISIVPSSGPSGSPTSIPSLAPSTLPSSTPSSKPSFLPSVAPSVTPSGHPTLSPLSEPSTKPSTMPSSSPSFLPTAATTKPSVSPVIAPSEQPVGIPTSPPTKSVAPSYMPSSAPTQCLDENGWVLSFDLKRLLCEDIIHPELFCNLYAQFGYYKGKTVNEACCICGGGSHIESTKPSSKPSMVPSISSAPSTTVEPSVHPSTSTYPSASPSSRTSLHPTVTFNPSIDSSSLPSGTPSVSQKPSLRTSTRPSVSSNPSSIQYINGRDVSLVILAAQNQQQSLSFSERSRVESSAQTKCFFKFLKVLALSASILLTF